MADEPSDPIAETFVDDAAFRVDELVPQPAPVAATTIADVPCWFTGTVPSGASLVGSFDAHRLQESLWLVRTEDARSRRLVINGIPSHHVSDGPDGRWQYAPEPPR
jgi:hypothetical protein